MVDEVEIKNVGGRNGVASEVTLQRLVTALEKSKSLDNKSKKNIEDLAKASKNTTKAFESFSKEIEKTTTIVEDVGQALKKTFTLDNFGKVLGYAAGATTNFAKELTSGGNELGDFAQHIPIIGGSLETLTGFFQDSLDTFRNLSDVGAVFGNDLMALRNTAARSSMPLDMFADMVRNNTEVLRILGASTSDGADRMGQLSKNLRNSRLGDQLFNMGFTMEELNDGLGDFMKIQARSGRLQGMTNTQLVNGTSMYLTELDKLSRQTGISRKQLQETMAADANKANLAILEAKMTREQAIEFRAGLATVRNIMPGLGDAVEDLADGIPQSDVAKKLASLSPAFAEAAAQFGAGAISQEEFLKSLQTEGGPALRDWMMSLDAAQQQQLASKAGFSELFDSFGGLNNFLQTNFADVSAEQARRQLITDGLSRFEDAIAGVRSKFLEAFITSGLLDVIGAGLVKFGDMLVDVTNYVADFAKEIAEDGFLSAIGGVLMDGLKSIFNNPGTIAAVVGGIAALFAAKAVTGALAGAFKTAVTSTVGGAANRLLGRADTPSAGSGRRGGGLARGAANAGKGIGGFLGQLSEALMKGAANGLKAFTPPVLQGAVILGGVITAIGAGIAGASWILGKTLPTFIDGLKKFEDIDGGALVDAAKGMGAISAAMAAFGAGTAVAGLGAMVGGITGAIGKLFGADDPLEKLKEFGEANINAAQVKNNADAMVAFSKAMAAAGGGNAVEGLGALVNGIAGGLGKLFGADDPLEKLKEFSEANINAAQVKNNAEAMVAFSNAMTSAAGGNAVEGLGTLVSGIAGGLGKLAGGSDTSDVIDSMIAFSEKQVDSAVVKSNAEAMVAFSNAMSVAAGANAAEGLGTFVSGVLGGIGAFFGGESSLEQFKRFGETDLDPNGLVGKNAEAMGRFSTAMSNVVSMPEQGVFESFKSAIAGLFGGDTAFSQLEDFANLDIDREGVKANAEAMMYFSTAMSDVSMMPEQGVFESIRSTLATVFGGENAADQLKAFGAEDLDPKGFIKSNAEAMMYFSTAMSDVSMMPEQGIFKSISTSLGALFGGDSAIKQLKAFGLEDFDSKGFIKSNAEAMVYFSTAMANVTMMPEAGVFKSIGSALAGIFGGDTALDQLKTFGETNLDPNGIVKSNAEAMVSMSTAFSSIKSVSDVEIDKNLVNRLNQLSSVGDLSGFAANIKQLSGLDATLGVNALNSLDSSGVVQYTTAMESLVDVLKELNQELTKDNKAGFGTGTNAGTVVSKMDSIGSGGGSGMSQDTAEKLNTTLASVLEVLEESRDYHKDTAKAVKSGDLQRGV